jgi:hypothetical protein
METQANELSFDDMVRLETRRAERRDKAKTLWLRHMKKSIELGFPN